MKATTSAQKRLSVAELYARLGDAEQRVRDKRAEVRTLCKELDWAEEWIAELEAASVEVQFALRPSVELSARSRRTNEHVLQRHDDGKRPLVRTRWLPAAVATEAER